MASLSRLDTRLTDRYGVLGDSVNVAARLKSLNSHFATCCLVSDESLEEAPLGDGMGWWEGCLIGSGELDMC